MRKAIGLALAGLTVVMLSTAPAHALKDPFDPLVKPETETGSTTTNGTTTVDEPIVTTNENPFSEGMPNTGADTSSWLVLSYVLLVAGGASLVLAWTRRPAPARRQVFRS
jgi:hypothetical protein